jgi:hypothetical protein
MESLPELVVRLSFPTVIPWLLSFFCELDLFAEVVLGSESTENRNLF